MPSSNTKRKKAKAAQKKQKKMREAAVINIPPSHAAGDTDDAAQNATQHVMSTDSDDTGGPAAPVVKSAQASKGRSDVDVASIAAQTSVLQIKHKPIVQTLLETPASMRWEYELKPHWEVQLSAR